MPASRPGHRREVAFFQTVSDGGHPMAAYVIGELIDVTDSAGFAEYRRRVPASIERYSGRFIVRRGRMETLDGAWQPKGLVVIKFPTIGAGQHLVRLRRVP